MSFADLELLHYLLTSKTFIASIYLYSDVVALERLVARGLVARCGGAYWLTVYGHSLARRTCLLMAVWRTWRRVSLAIIDGVLRFAFWVVSP